MKTKYNQVCKTTVINSSYPGILFDSNGVCSLVRDFKKEIQPIWTQIGEKSERQLKKTIAKIKKNSIGKKYDSIIGLSGGLDSTYMLHLMVKHYGLRPLVFHVDGGWNTEIAVSNIEKIVTKLGVDFYTEVIDWIEMRAFQLAMFESGVPHIDIPQDMAFIGVLYKFASENNIKYIFNGGNISTECVPRPIELVSPGADMYHLNDILKKFSKIQFKNFPFTSVWNHKIYLKYVKGISVIKPLNMINFIRTDAVRILEKEYGWVDYQQKHFESRFTRFYEGYWLPTRFNFDMQTVNLSSLILTGQLSRDDANKILESQNYSEELIRSDIDYVCSKLDITVERLMHYQAMPLKYYSDYRNQKFLFKIGEYFSRKIFGHRRGGAM